MLCAYITLAGFKAAQYSHSTRKAKRIIKLDSQNNTVLYNDNGRCSVEQFGSLPVAVAKYKEIKACIV